MLAQSSAAAQLHAEGSARLAVETQLRQASSELGELRQRLASTSAELASARAAAAKTALLDVDSKSGEVETATGRAKRAENALLENEAASAQRVERAEREAQESAQREGLLRLDKDYLSKQLEGAQDRLCVLESKLTKKDGRLAELKAEKDAMYDKLLAATSEQQQSYGARLESEMSKWQQQANTAAAVMRDTHDRQVEQLREARDLALADTDKWHTRYAELKRQHDEHLLASAQQLANAEVQLATARSELKLKCFEAERLSAQCEQSIAASRRDELTSDATREKLEVLKAEYYALQVRSTERGAELEAKLSAAMKKLSSYEQLESELDQMVVAEGSDLQGGAVGAAVVRVPSSAQRRLDQCLALSRELLVSQRKVEEQRAALADRTAEVERLREQLGDAQQCVRQAGQPHGYLIEQLQVAEQQIQQQQRQALRANDAHAESQEALASALQQHRLLKVDLERVLQQRGSLEALRSTLARLMS